MLSVSKYLTTEEMADRLGLATKTLCNWRSSGQGPPHKRFGKRVLYPIPAVEKWEAEHPYLRRGRGHLDEAA